MYSHWHVIALILPFILHKSLEMDYLINPKHIARNSERKNMMFLTENLAYFLEKHRVLYECLTYLQKTKKFVQVMSQYKF